MKKCEKIRRMFFTLLAVVCVVNCMASAASAKTYFVVSPREESCYIVPEANENYALDLCGGGTATGTYFQLWELNRSDAQIFRIEHVDGDWYRIVHEASGKVVNVESGISKNDARLWLYPYDGTDSCLFRFVGCENGSYIIQSKLDGERVLDLHNNQTFNSSTIHLWDLHDGQAARWKLIPVSNVIPGVQPPAGDYCIVPEGNSGFAIDLSGGGTASGTYFQLWELNQSDAQVFRFEHVSGDWYKIVHRASGKVLNVKDGISKNDARLWLYEWDETDAALFRFLDAGGGSYIIQSKLSGQRVLDLDANKQFNGSVIHLWDYHTNQSARWRLIPAPAPVQPQGLADANQDRVSFIRQRTSTCKATSAAMAVNLIVGSDTYSTDSMIYSGVMCKNLNGNTYRGSDGATYVTTYKTDSYVGSLSEVTSAVETAVASGLPIVAAVHKGSGTRHHWILIVGKNSSGQYLAVDPSASGSGTIASQVRTMDSMGYSFGLTDYSTTHYGYISFTRR